MSGEPDPALGGGANSRPRDDSLAETGPGIPDEAIGPEQRSISEFLSMGDGPEEEAFARKLLGRRKEADEDGAP